MFRVMGGGVRQLRRLLSPYRPNQYWRNAGRIPMNDTLRKQAVNILRYLDELKFDSVYEVGVGEGRIAEIILNTRAISSYDSCDMTPVRRDVVAAKLKRYPQFGVRLESFQEADLQHTYDLILAVECLMHIKRDDLSAVIRKMANHAHKYIVNVDYWERVPVKYLAPHNFAHDYKKLYKSMGLTCRLIELPYRQALFIATPG